MADNAPVYRYFTTNLLTNQTLAEIPFKGVQYERAIKGAGKFSGSIPYIPETVTFNLYEHTMPGKTGLYITRDGVCVWGGIIWSRSYDVESRVLKVDASEFTSYFYHRNIWKTYSHDFSATIVASGGVAQITLDTANYSFVAGNTVRVIFYEVGDFQYNGYYTILASPVPSGSVCSVSIPGLPNGTYTLATVYVRVDTYDYIRQLLDSMLIDYANVTFPNDEIEPGVTTPVTITSRQRQTNVATLTTDVDHGLILGQEVTVVNLGFEFDGVFSVTSIPNSTTFTYESEGTNIAYATVSTVVRTVNSKTLTNFDVTLTTTAAHGFTPGDEIVISGVDDPAQSVAIFDGTYVIHDSPGSNFSYYVYEVTDVPVTAASGTATKTPTAYVSTYGSYFSNADIGLNYAARNKVPIYPGAAALTAAGLPTNLYPTSPTPTVAGNITLTSRPLVTNDDGTISTLYSESYNDGSNEVIYPRIIGGQLFSSSRAQTYYQTTGQHLGKFASGNIVDAEAYATELHNIQEAWLDLITYEWSDQTYSGKNLENKMYRGYELRSVGEELDNYSDTIDGFEYRIDCDYDIATDSFLRTMVLLPINYPDPPNPGEASPISRFGADQLVFDYPGSIINVEINESAEHAATRFFVVGNIGDLGQDASQPYAAAVAKDLLEAGWPLLDQEETIDHVSVSATSSNPTYIDTGNEETLYKYAKRYLTEFRPPVADIKVTVNGSLQPYVGTYDPGDWCAIVVNDEFIRARLASDLEPRDTVIVRKIDSFSVDVPDTPTFPEKVSLELIAEWEVDKRG